MIDSMILIQKIMTLLLVAKPHYIQKSSMTLHYGVIKIKRKYHHITRSKPSTMQHI